MIPFRTRQLLHRVAVTILALLVVASALLAGWLLWLNRYIIYTRDGAKLDFGLPPELTPGQSAVAPTQGKPVDIVYQDGSNNDQTANALSQLKGCYADTVTLLTNFDATAESLRKCSADTAIMLDVKNAKGEFYYSSALGKTAPGIETEKMDALIRDLKATDHYLIARLPAFREYWYILEDEWERVPYGLPQAGGNGSLWLDESGPNYWMDPASEGTLGRLLEIVSELKALGFDEVVFDDFLFPETDRVVYSGDKEAILAETASVLVKVCATEQFAVSFVGTSPSFPLPEGRSRLYMDNVTAAELDRIVEQTGLEDASVRLVFLTPLLDTRFDDYGALRPANILG